MKHIARKRFGQHFLSDQSVIAAIVDAINPQPAQPMVEIGPGLAALTQPLVERLGHLTVIELDRDLAARLRTRAQLRVVESDVLRVDFAALARDVGAPKLRVVGNLPYNISTPILFHLLAHVDVVQDQHFMLQKEVIDRMVAMPATADYGRLSVMLDVALLEELVKVAFSQRRKLLRHTLGQWLQARSFPGDFDVQRRAEEVPVAEYTALAQAVSAHAQAAAVQ